MPPPGPEDLQSAVRWMREHFDAEAAAELNAVYQFELSGERGGHVAFRVAGPVASFACERAPKPDVCFRVSAEDWFGILTGRENADLLYMAGRLEIDGDLGLAVRLRNLFRAR